MNHPGRAAAYRGRVFPTYRTRLKADPEARTNFAFAATKRFILGERRTFTEVVEATFGLPAAA